MYRSGRVAQFVYRLSYGLDGSGAINGGGRFSASVQNGPVSCSDRSCVLFRSLLCPVQTAPVTCSDRSCFLFRPVFDLFRPVLCPVQTGPVTCSDRSCVLFRQVFDLFRPVL